MEKYNKEWFKKRALNGLKKKAEGVWDYTDSLLLYTSSGAQVYEELQEVDTPYFHMVTKPEREYLKSIAKNIADILPDNFEYIDLGPGTEHKEQFLFDELKKQNKKFTYVPVDISDHFLDAAESHASKQGISTRKIKASFEELAEALGNQTVPRFVSIGLTFSNYEAGNVLALLESIAGKNGYCFINAQIRERTDMVELQKIYQADAQHIADDKLKLIGLNLETDVTERITDSGFHVTCKIIKSNEVLRGVGIHEGDTLIVFQSLRYSQNSLESELAHLNHRSFDTRGSFIGTIIMT